MEPAPYRLGAAGKHPQGRREGGGEGIPRQGPHGVSAGAESCRLWEAQDIPIPSLVKYLPSLAPSQRSSVSQPSQRICPCPRACGLSAEAAFLLHSFLFN